VHMSTLSSKTNQVNVRCICNPWERISAQAKTCAFEDASLAAGLATCRHWQWFNVAAFQVTVCHAHIKLPIVRRDGTDQITTYPKQRLLHEWLILAMLWRLATGRCETDSTRTNILQQDNVNLIVTFGDSHSINLRRQSQVQASRPTNTK